MKLNFVREFNIKISIYIDHSEFIWDWNLFQLSWIDAGRGSFHKKLAFHTSCKRIFWTTVEGERSPKESKITAITENSWRLVYTNLSSVTWIYKESFFKFTFSPKILCEELVQNKWVTELEFGKSVKWAIALGSLEAHFLRWKPPALRKIL